MLFNIYLYRICNPLVVHFQRGPDDRRLSVLFMVTPADEEDCVAQHWVVMNYAHEVPAQIFQDLESQVASQDITVVESQRPRRLPLDLQTEVHVLSDRYCIAYRKWLMQQGVTFGTI